MKAFTSNIEDIKLSPWKVFTLDLCGLKYILMRISS